MSNFRFIVQRTDEIAVLRFIGDGCRDLNRQTVWTRTKSRQPRQCAVVSSEIIQTGDWCWSPMTNAVYRGARISAFGMGVLKRRLGK